jgi:multimeric flavodoxin WrbA
MSQTKTVLLLNGSPKGEKSNSRVIGRYLADKLEEKGLKSEESFVVKLVQSQQGIEKFYRQVDEADVIVFTTPLYVDSLPSFTIKSMEILQAHRRTQSQPKQSLIVPVINCGFPEKEHMEIALKILRNFAVAAGLCWAGAVSVGMGMALNGEPLREKKGMTRNLTRGLALAAASLAEGQPISSEAEELTSKSFLPLFLVKPVIRAFGKQMWRGQAQEDGAKPDMYAKPYEMH